MSVTLWVEAATGYRLAEVSDLVAAGVHIGEADHDAAARLRAGQRIRWCEAHHDVVDYGRDDACRIALRINDEAACEIAKYALVRLASVGMVEGTQGGNDG